MKKEEIKEYLRVLGYTENKYGHMKKEFPNKIRRYKFQKISLRIENKGKKPGTKWFNESWGQPIYYKNLSIINGKLTIKK